MMASQDVCSLKKKSKKISAYSRTLTTLNFGCSLKRDLNKLIVLHTMEYKYGTIYRSVVRTPPTDFFSIMAGGDGNPIFTMMIAVIKDSIPNLFHPCPYKLSHHKYFFFEYFVINLIFTGFTFLLQHNNGK